ncbi:hypothetical protein AAVH_27575 [Aphelenchoides avenae]|nr:hypothetical protein AAVH_27575 [Aphelenchus avenae]
MSDNAQQKGSAANNADQPPPPQDTAGETIGEAIRVPTLMKPPARRSEAAADGKDAGKKKKAKRTPSSNTQQEKGPSGPKTHAVKRSDRTPSRDKRKPKADKRPSGPTTPPGKPAENTPRNAQTPPKGPSEPTSTPKNTPVFRIPKVKDTRPVRDPKEEAAARLREKNLSAKKTAFPHYELGNHPLNPEEPEEWDVTPIVKRGGLVSSYVALGHNAEHYNPKPKGSYDPTIQKQQKGSSDPTGTSIWTSSRRLQP